MNHPANGQFYFGWWIVVFTFMLQFAVVGLCYYTFSVYLKPLTEALGSDRFSVSIAMSLQMGVSALLSPIAGKLFAEKSLKALLLFGTGMLLLGHLLMSQVTSVWQLYVVWGGVLGIAQVSLGAIPCNLMLANWFNRRRGSALGISQFGITISGTVLVPLVTWLIITYGWRTAPIICGAVAAVVLVPLILKLAIRAPSDLGLNPDGDAEPAASANTEPVENWDFLRAVKERDIWALTFTVGPCYFGVSAVILGMHSHMTDIDIDALTASSIVAVTTLFGAIAKPLFGILSDHLPKKACVAIALLLQAIGVLLIINLSAVNALYVAGALFGLGYGAMSPLWAVLLATRYGAAAFAKIMGAGLLLLMPFNLSGLPITTYVYSLTGSYIPAFEALMFGYVIAALGLWMFRLHDPTK